MRCIILIGCLVLLLLAGHNPAWGLKELSDEELDQVSAGKLSTEIREGALHFRFGDDKGGTRSIDGSGSIALNDDNSSQGLGSIVVRDYAQGNLQSFININAVNSLIQMLINLNVNIHSNVGTLRQINLSRDF